RPFGAPPSKGRREKQRLSIASYIFTVLLIVRRRTNPFEPSEPLEPIEPAAPFSTISKQQTTNNHPQM
ncbi:MAG: hypothetical protein MR569_06730, partial [Dialister sp.]|nr:hypothetical protein [Dialister sp.]